MADQSASCPMCAAGKSAQRYHVEIPLLGVRAIRECLACGLFFVTPRPRRQELEEFYGREYYSSTNAGRGYSDYFRKTHARWGEGYIYGRSLGKTVFEGRALEVGAGSGEFLRGVLDGAGWREGFGTDLSAWAVRFASEKCPEVQWFCGSLEEAHLPDGSFDVVFLRDVLEHVVEPAPLLAEVHRVLKCGARLFLQVPNAPADLTSIARANRAGKPATNVQAHLNFFPPRCLRRSLEDRGFVAERIYTLGLKRGLRNMGYLPRRDKGAQVASCTAASQAAVPPAAGVAVPRWKYSKFYAWWRFRMKNSVKLPEWLPLGHELHAEAHKK